MHQVSRRTLLQILGATVLVTPLLQACGGASAAPAATAAAQAKALASAAQTSASAAAAQTTASAAQATTASAAAAAPGTAKTPLSVGVWVNGTRTWQGTYAQKWATENPTVDLQIVQIPYANIEQKTLVEIAANSLQDIIFTQCKSLPKLASAGAYLALDSFVQKAGGQGVTDFFPAAIANATVDGKLWGIPFEINTGNTDIIMYNVDLLTKAGATTPTDTWTFDDFISTAKKLTDAKNRVWGTDLFPGTYYDFDCYVRSNGGELLSADGKKFQLTDNKASTDAAQWLYNLRTTDQVAPNRADSQGLAFPAGQIALHSDGIQSIIGLKQSIGSKFKWDVVLAPVSSTGLRGYEIFSSMWALYAKTKQADLAYQLLTYLNSPETQAATLTSQGQPPSRVSVWKGKEAADISPIWGRIADWLSNGKDKGPFPMPYNFKYAELEAKWENDSYSLWYGQDAFDAGMKQTQTDCQAIMDTAR